MLPVFMLMAQRSR